MSNIKVDRKGIVMIFIKDKDTEYRIDKEEFGCSIRGKGVYIEGNATVYTILEMYSNTRSVEKVVLGLKEQEEFFESDIMEMLDSVSRQFQDAGVFEEFCLAIKEFHDRNH